MNTQEFLRVSFILDKYGLHKEADRLTAIAQNTSIPDLQKRIDYYTNKIEAYKKQTDPKFKNKMLLWLSTHIEKNYYEDNKLDYASYQKLMKDLGEYVDLPKNEDAPTAQPSSKFPVTLAPSSIGSFEKPGETYNLEEDRNLAGLHTESNQYLASDSFKKSIEDRINQIKEDDKLNNKTTDTTKLQELLNKANTPEGYKAGDLGPAELYGTKFRSYKNEYYKDYIK